jgi:hypothetical protein
VSPALLPDQLEDSPVYVLVPADASTLVELGQRNGLRLLKFAGIGISNPQTLNAKLFFSMQPLMTRCGLSPLLFAKSIIYEFSRAS